MVELDTQSYWDSRNEEADELASQSLRIREIGIKFQKSLRQLKTEAMQYPKRKMLAHHQLWTDRNSMSATWYRRATNMIPHCLDKSTTRMAAVIIHRLRLGYRCTWEIVERVQRACAHCNEETEEPLLHYLLVCEHTAGLRRAAGQVVYDPALPDARDKAASMAQKILENIEVHINTLIEYMPPR